MFLYQTKRIMISLPLEDSNLVTKEDIMGRSSGTKLAKITLNNPLLSPKHRKRRNNCYSNCVHKKNISTSLVDFLASQLVGSVRAILYWLQFVFSEQIFRTLQKESCCFYSKVESNAFWNPCIMFVPLFFFAVSLVTKISPILSYGRF